VVSVDQQEPLRAECQHFLDCISSRNTPRTSAEEGLRVLKVLNACQTSLETGRTIRSGKNGDSGNSYSAHETAIIDENVSIGANTKIWHFSHVLPDTTIGKDCNIGQNVVLGPKAKIGNGCKIQNNVSIYEGITLEDEVFCGPSMVFTNVYNPRAAIRKMDKIRITTVRKGATIGANATIVCGVSIGQYSFVGAGAVVNKDVPAHALVVGNPAKMAGWVCVCGETLPDSLECTVCGKKFTKTDTAIETI
jgi:UDP-2-acetamido-3-amino-2,3-dideoxy-glucuronate N-acetyltransferase